MEFAMIRTGWVSLLPPLIAITLALLTKEVYFSLFIGLFSGMLIYSFAGGGTVISAVHTTFDMMSSKIADNAYMIVFLLFIGGLVLIGYEWIVSFLKEKKEDHLLYKEQKKLEAPKEKKVKKQRTVPIIESTVEEKPKKEKPETDEKAKNREDTKEPSKISRLFAHKKAKLGFTGAVKFFLDVLKEVLQKLVWAIRKIKFDRFKLNLVVASEDAATTAINYGCFCTAVYPLLSFLCSNTNLELKEVNISADYEKTAVDLDLCVRLKTRLIYFLVLAIKLLNTYRKLIKEVDDDE